jgi:beta-glucosidase
VLVISSSYPYSVTWADANVPAILWSSHGGQEVGHAMADVLLGDAEPAGRLPQTWYRSHAELPDLFDYDIITSDATYLYYRGTPLYPFGHGLSYTEFEYRDMRLSADTLAGGGRLEIEIDVANVGACPGEEVVQLYTHQQRSRVKQPLRRLRAFARVALDPGEQRTVRLELGFDDLAFWDVTSGRMVVETSTHKVMVGRSATDIRLCRTLSVRGQRIGPRRNAVVNTIDGDESCGVEPAPLSPVRGDGLVSTESGAWVAFGATDLSRWSRAAVTVAGGAGRLTLRADDPLDGEVLAAFDCPGGPRYEQREVAAALVDPRLADLYLVWDAPGIVAGTLTFS